MQRTNLNPNRWTLIPSIVMLTAIGISSGCASWKHHWVRHSLASEVADEHQSRYYHCSHCGQIVPKVGFYKCPRCLQIPIYHGYEPTRWRRWPDGWGCPPESTTANPEFWSQGLLESDAAVEEVEVPEPVAERDTDRITDPNPQSASDQNPTLGDLNDALENHQGAVEMRLDDAQESQEIAAPVPNESAEIASQQESKAKVVANPVSHRLTEPKRESVKPTIDAEVRTETELSVVQTRVPNRAESSSPGSEPQQIATPDQPTPTQPIVATPVAAVPEARPHSHETSPSESAIGPAQHTPPEAQLSEVATTTITTEAAVREIGPDQGHSAEPPAPVTKLPLPTAAQQPSQASRITEIATSSLPSSGVLLLERRSEMVTVAPIAQRLTAVERTTETPQSTQEPFLTPIVKRRPIPTRTVKLTVLSPAPNKPDPTAETRTDRGSVPTRDPQNIGLLESSVNRIAVPQPVSQLPIASPRSVLSASPVNTKNSFPAPVKRIELPKPVAPVAAVGNFPRPVRRIPISE